MRIKYFFEPGIWVFMASVVASHSCTIAFLLGIYRSEFISMLAGVIERKVLVGTAEKGKVQGTTQLPKLQSCGDIPVLF